MDKYDSIISLYIIFILSARAEAISFRLFNINFLVYSIDLK